MRSELKGAQAMQCSRRTLLTRLSQLSTLAIASWPSTLIATAGIERSRPDPTDFESGDLLWPKKPDAYIPYQFDSGMLLEQEHAQWVVERDRFVAANERNSDYLTHAQIDELKSMSFEDFYARYAGGLDQSMPSNYGLERGVHIGHVALVDRSAVSSPSVIEALWSRGVVRRTYAQWIEERSDQFVWHSRIRNLSVDQRSSIAARAALYVGRPYDFWNLNLADERGFYCSKLIWLATIQSTGVALDDNPDPRRAFWLSPKQLLDSPKVESRSRPSDNYAFPRVS